MLFSEPKIPQSRPHVNVRTTGNVSVLFSEPKIPQFEIQARQFRHRHKVSVLFSEPKIPQCAIQRQAMNHPCQFQCSSASRKFLNAASTTDCGIIVVVSVLFSEPKIPQFCECARVGHRRHGFSALQRAENSSMRFADQRDEQSFRRFSALQRAENSSMYTAD